MDKSVIFGAGSVGRGFIGQLFSESGLQVLFVDVDRIIIDAINQSNSYPHFTVTSMGNKQTTIRNVQSISSADENRVIAAVAEASIVATAVGANALQHIAPVLARGLRKRAEMKLGPINILLCENLHHAAFRMKELLSRNLDDYGQNWLENNVGLLETSIGRMIPLQTDEIKSIHPAAVMTEPYGFLPFNIKAVKGTLPQIKGLVGDPDIPFEFYSDRKLYIHNLGHCFCAYLGEYFGDEYIHQSVQRSGIRYFIRNAMIESALVLAEKYHQSTGSLADHVDDLLLRFGNKGLQDTLARVGRDPERKMMPEDRFVGAFMLARKSGMPRRFLSLATACGLNKLMQAKHWNRQAAGVFLSESTGIGNLQDPDIILVMSLLDQIRSNNDFNEINNILGQSLVNDPTSRMI